MNSKTVMLQLVVPRYVCGANYEVATARVQDQFGIYNLLVMVSSTNMA